MDSLIRMFNPQDVAPITIAEVKHFAQLKYDEQEKIKGQIARDLNRIGENAWKDPTAYTKLKAKYKAAHAGKKKLTILERERIKWCNENSGGM